MTRTSETCARVTHGNLHGPHMGIYMGHTRESARATHENPHGTHMGPHTGFQMQGGAYGTETCGKPFHKSLYFR